MRKFLIICVVSLSLILFGCKKEEAPVGEPVSVESGLRKTVLYFQDENSMLVPVMKRIPWESGIGKAALSYLVNTPENEQSAQSLGLKNVLPAETEISLRIEDGLANVNLVNVDKFENQQQEQNAISAIVNTLTEFPAVERVKIKINGKDGQKLEHGTDLATVFSSQDINIEASANTTQLLDNKVILYFASANSELNVPITRYLFDVPTLESTILELIKGPNDLKSLKNCFPEGTEILDVQIKDDIATINLSKEFERLREHPELEQRAIETLNLTCRNFGINTVNIKVEGKEYKTDANTMAPAFANEFN